MEKQKRIHNSIYLKKVDLEYLRQKLVEFMDSETPYAKITTVLLGLIALPGFLAVAFAVPNLFSCFGKIENKRKYTKRCVATIAYAKKTGFIKRTKKDNESFFVLTQKGKEKLYFEVLNNLKIHKPSKWDGRWRIVIFDIPNQHNRARDFLRNKLQNLKFEQLQKSVFVCPWECLKEIDILRKAFNIEEYVSVITAEKIENESKLMKWFNVTHTGRK